MIESLYPCPKTDLIRSLAVGREDFSQLTKTERTKRRLRSVRDHRGFDLISAVLPFGRYRRDGKLSSLYFDDRRFCALALAREEDPTSR